MKKNLKKALIAIALMATNFASFAECSTSFDGGTQYYEDGYLIPHRTDYSRFFKCNNGYWVDMQCPALLWFNPASQVCDFPWNVENPGGVVYP